MKVFSASIPRSERTRTVYPFAMASDASWRIRSSAVLRPATPSATGKSVDMVMVLTPVLVDCLICANSALRRIG